MKVIYVAGKYRAEHAYQIWRNVEVAREMSIKVWEMGHVAMSPHLNSMLFDGCASEQAFVDGTLELMRRCDAVLVCPGWQNSSGTRGEIAEAKRLGLPVFYSPEELEEFIW